MSNKNGRVGVFLDQELPEVAELAPALRRAALVAAGYVLLHRVVVGHAARLVQVVHEGLGLF